MLNTDRDALECDMAQYYQIYNMEELGALKLSVYAYGLPEDSRIKRKLSGQKVSTNTLLLAMAVDALNMLVWSKTKDAQHNKNRPKNIAQSLVPKQEDDVDHNNYKTGQEFEKARQALIDKLKGGK